MKRRQIIFLFIVTAFFSSCIKNDPVLFTGSVAEIDQTVWNANATGQNYPILTRVPAQNRPVFALCPDSTLRRTQTTTVRVRVNQVGPVSAKDETVGYKIFDSPVSTVSMPATIAASTAGTAGAVCTAQTPAFAAATLTVSNAVAGTHYTALSGKVTIPANSSFGYIDIQILNAGAAAGQARFIGIELDETGTIKPSVNYSKLGLVIDQR